MDVRHSSMSLSSNFELLADYNQWMNCQLYDAAAKLPSRDLIADRGAFFGSVIDTLNHIYVGDLIWLQRFAGHPAQFSSLELVRNLPTPQALDSVVHSELKQLREARNALDDVIKAFVREPAESQFASALSYSNTRGIPFSKPLAYLIQHFFNHQTHHRGQITTLLNQFGVDAGTTDLLVLIPDL